MSLEHWDAGSIPAGHSGVKDPALPQLWCRSQLPLLSDPCPRNSICWGVAKKGKKKRKSSFETTNIFTGFLRLLTLWQALC